MSQLKNRVLLGFVITLALFFLAPFNSPIRAQGYGGDADQNAKTDGSDYAVWLLNYNTNTTEGMRKGDFNNSGKVDGVDYAIWVINYGKQAPKSAYARSAPWPISGRIQAEDYDWGGNNVSYSDTTTSNDGNTTYRREGVDLRLYGSDVVVGNTSAGEWLEYTMNNASSSSFTLTLHGGTTSGGRVVNFTWNGLQVAQVTVPQVAAWGTHQSVSVPNVQIPAGEGVLRMTFVSDFQNIDWFEFIPGNDPLPITYPRELETSNTNVRFIETKAPENNKVFIKAEIADTTVDSEIRADWSVNGGEYIKEYDEPFFLGGDNNGTPKGYQLNTGSNTVHTYFYYNNYNSRYSAQFTYNFSGTSTLPTTQPTVAPVPTPTPPAAPTPTPPPVSTTSKLRWSPPTLTNPQTINLGPTTAMPSLSPTSDYIVNLPTTGAYTRRFNITGGRNVVVKGGELSVNADTTANENAAIVVKDSTGIVHLEGLRLKGAFLTDGIHTAAPNAIIQMQNIYVDPMWQEGDPDNGGSHGDCIQTWGGVKELRVDKYTCVGTPYQGYYLQANYGKPHGSVFMSRVDVTGTSSARYMFWVTAGTYDPTKTITLDDVWVNSTTRNLDRATCYYTGGICPNFQVIATDGNGVEYITWPGTTHPKMIGRVNEGLPPGGRFVSPTSVGLGYTSPGYQ